MVAIATVRHGLDGWSLVKYAWSPETGIGTFTYERGKATLEVQRAQPAHPKHAGWYIEAAKLQ